MKKLIIGVCVALIVTSTLFATYDLVTDFELKNAQADGTHFTFEIWMKAIDNWDNDDWDNGDLFKQADFYLYYNENALSNPVLTDTLDGNFSGNGYTHGCQINGPYIWVYPRRAAGPWWTLINGTNYHLYTVRMDIGDPTQESDLYWHLTATAAENGAGETTADGGATTTFIGNGDITLPVELSTFTIEYLNNMAVLYWVTQSETDNIGWNGYRNTKEEFQSAVRINNDLIPGHGTTSEPHSYIYEDEIENATPGDIYWYWLESIDLGGQSHIYQIASSIEIPDPNDPGYNVEVPVLYNVINAPNPLNSYTKIHFTLSEPAIVKVSIYNTLGKLVRTLTRDVAVQDGQAYKGTSYWNGKDNNGTDLPTGIYLYQLEVNSKPYTQRN